MKYDAFISYRHQKLDKAIAENLQKKLEEFRPPQGIEYKNTKKITRIFRDESELPTSNDLSADIRAALEQSNYLIVLCSPQFKESKWCMQEINYFIELHDGRTNHILPILVEGNPAETFPQALRYDIRTVTLEDGSQRKMKVEVEPLAANVSGGTMANVLKKLNVEFMRIAAPILGCSFDELYGRHQRRARSRIIKTVVAVIVAVSVFAGGLLYQNIQVQKQRDRALMNQSLALADRSRQMNESGDKTMGLLLAMEALPKNLIFPERPYSKEAKWALFENIASERSGVEIIDDYDYMSRIDPHKKVGGSTWSIESEDGSLRLDYFHTYSYQNKKTEIHHTRTGKIVYIDKTYEIMGISLFGALAYPEYTFFSKNNTYVLISGNHGFAVFKTADGSEVYTEVDREVYRENFRGTYNAAISDDEKHLIIFEDEKLSLIDLSYSSNYSLDTHGNIHPKIVLVDKLNFGRNSKSNPVTLAFSKDSEYFLFSIERNILEVWEVISKTEGHSYNKIFSLQDNNLLTGYFTDENDIVVVYKNGNKRVINNPSIVHPDQNIKFADQRDINQIIYNKKEDKLCVSIKKIEFDENFDYYNNNPIKIFDANKFKIVYEMQKKKGTERIISNDGKYISESFKKDKENIEVTLFDITGKMLNQFTYLDDNTYSDYPGLKILSLYANKYILVGSVYTASARTLGRELYRYEKGSLINLKTNEIILKDVIITNKQLNTTQYISVANTFGSEIALSSDGEYYFHNGVVFETGTNKVIINIFRDEEILIAGFTRENYGFYIKTKNEQAFFIIKNGKAQRINGFVEGLPILLSKNGKYAAGFNGNQGYIWEASTGKLLKELMIPSNWYGVAGLAIGYDNYGISIDHYLNNNEQLPEKPYNIVVGDHLDNGIFLEDEKVLALIIGNGRLIFWDIDTGRVLAELQPLLGKYKSIILAQDRLIIESEYNISVIPIKTDALLSQAKKMLNGRELSPSERTSHYCEIK